MAVNFFTSSYISAYNSRNICTNDTNYILPERKDDKKCRFPLSNFLLPGTTSEFTWENLCGVKVTLKPTPEHLLMLPQHKQPCLGLSLWLHIPGTYATNTHAIPDTFQLSKAFLFLFFRGLCRVNEALQRCLCGGVFTEVPLQTLCT